MSSDVWYCPGCQAENHKSVLKEDYEKRLAYGSLTGEEFCYGCYIKVPSVEVYAGNYDSRSDDASGSVKTSSGRSQSPPEPPRPILRTPQTKPEPKAASAPPEESGDRLETLLELAAEEAAKAPGSRKLEEMYRRIIKMDPANVATLGHLADLYEVRGDHRKARLTLLVLHKALGGNEKDIPNNRRKAVGENMLRLFELSAKHLNDSEQAMQQLVLVMEIAPFLFEEYERFDGFIRNGSLYRDIAARAEETAAKIGDDRDACAMYTFGAHVCLENGDPMRARQLLRKGEKRKYTYSPLHLEKARFCGVEGDADRQLLALRKALRYEDRPDRQVKVMLKLGAFHEETMLDLVGALDIYRKAAALAPEDPEVKTSLKRVTAALGG